MTNPFRFTKYLWRSKRGHCPVCGKATLFLLTQIPEIIRNHAVCLRCRSSSRNRHIALHIIKAFRNYGVSRIGDFQNLPNIKILNTSTTTPLAKAFGRGPNIFCSEFSEDAEPGSIKDGILNQDLTRLTFADNSLDLVVTEDVFEHVPDYMPGFRQVHRVLKVGGTHIFSIPFYFDQRTRELFRMEENRPVLFEPIEYHGDPFRGNIPCFTHLGYDLIGWLEKMGFRVKIEFSSFAEETRYGTFDCYTFVTVKE